MEYNEVTKVIRNGLLEDSKYDDSETQYIINWCKSNNISSSLNSDCLTKFMKSESNNLNKINNSFKLSYIHEIKNGLGDEIKMNKGYQKDKITISTKINRFFNKLFKMF